MRNSFDRHDEVKNRRNAHIVLGFLAGLFIAYTFSNIAAMNEATSMRQQFEHLAFNQQILSAEITHLAREQRDLLHAHGFAAIQPVNIETNAKHK
ncbi:hypothetical protein PMO31116_00534 [Pandoraea morbifera]|uniref:Uncharacterized protein n=1 Tax=Pandoraea morbifera TaxID=2508300 RepID=A0A5E4S2P0_9BURK|nr:hypothetical protein [Pandoraea morbifera]VVD69665.1 hypothetical protein PMO31116_00534 [Pandoraea morbifera]